MTVTIDLSGSKIVRQSRSKKHDMTTVGVVENFTRLYPRRIGPLTLQRITQEASSYRRTQASVSGFYDMPHDICVVLFYLADVSRLDADQLAPVVDRSPKWVVEASRLGAKFVDAREGRLK